MILVSLVILFLLLDGLSFYLTPYADRPHHPDYRALRPAGSRGLLYGIIGTVMMLLMHLYSVRKRIKFLNKLGNLSRWLNFHIFLGIVGPVFILLHTSFKVQGLVALSFWSMVAVVLSGVLGRYIYLQIPRNLQGNQLNLKEIEQKYQGLTDQLRSEFNLNDRSMSRLEGIIRLSLTENVGSFPALWSMTKDDFLYRIRLRRKLKHFVNSLGIPGKKRHHLLQVLNHQRVLRRNILLLDQAKKLFHYWHIFHKPFAFTMYLILAVHIAVALWTGYARPF